MLTGDYKPIFWKTLPQMFAHPEKGDGNIFPMLDTLFFQYGGINSGLLLNTTEFSTESRRMAGAEVLRRIARFTTSFNKPFDFILYDTISANFNRYMLCCSELTLDLLSDTMSRLVSSGFIHRFGVKSRKGYLPPAYSLNYRKILMEVASYINVLNPDFYFNEKIEALYNRILNHSQYNFLCLLGEKLNETVPSNPKHLNIVINGVVESMGMFNQKKLEEVLSKSQASVANNLDKKSKKPIIELYKRLKPDASIEDNYKVNVSNFVALWDKTIQKYEKFVTCPETKMDTALHAKVKAYIHYLIRGGKDEEAIRSHVKELILGWYYSPPGALELVSATKEGKPYTVSLPSHPSLKEFLISPTDATRQLIAFARKYDRPDVNIKPFQLTGKPKVQVNFDV